MSGKVLEGFAGDLRWPNGLDAGRTFLTFTVEDRAMITSKLTSKAQTTIPQAVRAALRLNSGDEIAYAIEDGRVVITRATRVDPDDPFATFHEWGSEADRKGYADL